MKYGIRYCYRCKTYRYAHITLGYNYYPLCGHVNIKKS